jgi:hypothetical protein
MAQAPTVRARARGLLLSLLAGGQPKRANRVLRQIERLLFRQLPPALARPYYRYPTRCQYEIARAFHSLKFEGLAISAAHGRWQLTDAGLREAVAQPIIPPQARPNTVRRTAVEIRALEVSEAYYHRMGYRTRRRGRPYDLLALGNGERRTVEVKGLRSHQPVRIDLSAKEVRHARRHPRHDLIVIGDIQTDGDTASGGRIVYFQKNWRPDPSDLKPTQYRYRLPQPPEEERNEDQ